MFSKSLDHEVRVYLLNGTVVHFTLREMRQLYLSWQMWVLVSVGFFIMSTGHPVTLPQFQSFELRLAFWWLALAFYMLTSELYSKLTGRLWHRLFGKEIPLLLLSAPLVLASTYASAALLSILFEPESPVFQVLTWQMNVRNILVAHAFEMVALLWLIPSMRARKESRKGPRRIALAGRTFDLCDIGRVKAAEHHLEVYTETQCEVIRERMSTFLEQVGPEDGIQTHRSHWVAHSKVATLSGPDLRLTCGMKVPVARGRLDAVRDGISAHQRPETLV